MRKRFNYEQHPISIFINQELKMSVFKFSSATGYAQSTISTWIRSGRKIESLPVLFFAVLSNHSGKRMDEVYNDLIELEGEYVVNKLQDKTFLKDEGISLVEKAEEEALKIKLRLVTLGYFNDIPVIKRRLESVIEDERKFMQELIKLYGLVDRIVPNWVGMIFDDEGTFTEISVSYVKVFTLIN